MGKHKYSKGMCFVHILNSSISREMETDTIPKPKTWKKWILIVKQTYGKTETFKSSGFLTYFMWDINPFNSQNMGKMNSHSKENMEKIWKNTNISKLRVPKTWEKWILIVQEKFEKTQTFQIYGFIKYFGWSRNSYISQNMGNVNLLSTKKVWENTEICHIDFPNILFASSQI